MTVACSHTFRVKTQEIISAISYLNKDRFLQLIFGNSPFSFKFHTTRQKHSTARGIFNFVIVV